MITITINGRKYRCLEPATTPHGGIWEYEHKEAWHPVHNYEMKEKLNKSVAGTGSTASELIRHKNIGHDPDADKQLNLFCVCDDGLDTTCYCSSVSP